MKIKLISDIHQEFLPTFHPGEGEVLIMAGDILCAKDLGKESQQGKWAQRMIDNVSRNYDKVFYVMGNHEHYRYNISRTAERIREFLPDNVTLLNCQSEYYNGVHFVGATMWTDFRNEDPFQMLDAGSTMNDYQCIRFGPEYRKLTPKDVLKEHKETVNWFKKCVLTLNGPVVMVTHHAPTFKSIGPEYVDDSLNGCYASDLSDFILNNDNIKYWCHGHIHTSSDYMVGQCRVLTNPRGYDPDGLNRDFSQELEFDPLAEVLASVT